MSKLMRNVFLILPLMVVLLGCGESNQEAYDRGYEDGFHDGWADTCNRIDRFSSRINEALKSERIC